MNKREVELLDYHAATCPFCKETIYIPVYRLQPGTIEDLRRQGRELLERETP